MDDDSNGKKKATAGKPLTKDQISSKRMDRRTVLRSVGLAGLGAGAMGVSGCVEVPTAPVYGTGITDADRGPITDPEGRGRGGRRGYYTGIADADSGPITDPGGQGRGR